MLEASDGELADYFGSWIAASGGTILVGAWGDDDMATAAGAAYVFELTLGSSAASVPITNGVGAMLFAAEMLVLGVLRLKKTSLRNRVTVDRIFFGKEKPEALALNPCDRRGADPLRGRPPVLSGVRRRTVG